MMCHLDKTSYSRYNNRGFGGTAAAVARNAFWGERGGGGGEVEAGCEMTVPSDTTTWRHHVTL